MDPANTSEYASALAYLNSFIDYERQPDFVQAARFDLSRMKALLSRMGDPQKALPTIHVAGSKGKGSTATMIAAILQAGGWKVGLYTQPHLQDFRERIRVNGRKIHPHEVVTLVETRLRPAIEGYQRNPIPGELTFFEVHTALAFAHFADQAAVQVVEVGLGGRLDATNVVHPTVSVLTPISFEHTAVLGDTLTAIAQEKAGIIKSGVPVVAGRQTPEVETVLRKVCIQRGCRLIRAEECFTLPCPKARFTATGSHFSLTARPTENGFQASSWPDLFLPLAGPHQVENAATAVTVVETLRQEGWSIPSAALREGLARAQRAGCVQVVQEHPWLVLDGAHNQASAERLAETLHLLFLTPPEAGKERKGKLIIVLGAFRDKDVAGVVAPLAPLAGEILLTTTGHVRAWSPEELRTAIGSVQVPLDLPGDLETALATAQSRAHPEDVICVTGSLQLVGEALRILGVEVP